MKKPAMRRGNDSGKVRSPVIYPVRMDAETGPDADTAAVEPDVRTAPQEQEPTPATTTSSAEADVMTAPVPTQNGKEMDTLMTSPEGFTAAEPDTQTMPPEQEPMPAATTTSVEADITTMPAPIPNSKGMDTLMKSTEDFIAFGQGNVEAFVKASQIWAAGVQDLTKQVAAGAQANLDETMNAFKALSGAKTLKDAIDLQTGFARSTFEKSISESGKLTDASLKLAEQALAPITARVTAAMGGFAKAN